MSILVCEQHVSELIVPFYTLDDIPKDSIRLNKLLLEMDFKGNFENYDVTSQNKMKEALKYALNRGEHYCQSIFDNMLIEDFSPKEARNFLMLLWKHLFNEESCLQDVSNFILTEDENYCNSLKIQQNNRT